MEPISSILIPAITESTFDALAEVVGLSDWLRQRLGRDLEKAAFQQALTQALTDTVTQFPGRNLRYFAEILRDIGGAWLALTLQPAASQPTASELTQVWLTHLTGDSFIHGRVEFTHFASYFLERLNDHLENQQPLQWIIQARRLGSSEEATRRMADAAEQSAVDLETVRREILHLSTTLAMALQTSNSSTVATAGGAYIGGNVSAQHFAGRDMTIKNYFVAGLPRLVIDYSSRIQDFLLEYLGSKRKRVPFGGRQQQLAELNGWLDDPTAPPYYLLTAEAGRGKSALVCRWLAQLTTRADLAVIFVPISIRFETATQAVVFAALAARLAILYESEPEKLPPASLTAEQWKGVCQGYLRRDPPEGKKLIVILDGLDEATDWTPGRGLFSADPPDSLRVLVTARTRPDEIGASGWATTLGWENAYLARTAMLPALDRAGVAEALASMDSLLDLLAIKDDVVRELHRLSEGDPLLVKLLIDALQRQGATVVQLSPDQLHGLQPDPTAYFHQWWQQQQEQWQVQGRDSVEEQANLRLLRNAIATAMAPLTFDDLALLHPQLGQRPLVLKLLQSLSRWLVGDGNTRGYHFSHPRVGVYFWQQLGRNEQRDWDRRFTDWGERVLADLTTGTLDPTNTPQYLLRHYAAHLQRSNAPAVQFYALVSDGWRKAWAVLDESYVGFLNDVERVWLVAGNAYGPNKPGCGQALAQLVRAALCQASLAAISSNIPPELCVRLIELGRYTPAQAFVIAKRLSKKAQAEMLMALTPYLSTELLGETLAIIPKLGDDWLGLKVLKRLIPDLPADLLGRAMVVAHTFENERCRVYALVTLAPRLPKPDQLFIWDEAVATVKSGYEWIRFIPHLPDDLFDEVFDEVLDVARTLENNFKRSDLLIALALRLPEDKRGKVMEEAFNACLETNINNLIYALEKLVQHLPNQSMAKALAAVPMIEEDWGHEGVPADALAVLTPYLSPALLEEAVDVARTIEDKGERVRALAALIPQLPADARGLVLGEALVVARAIERPYGHAEALTVLVPYLPEREKLRVSREVLTNIDRINAKFRVKALSKLAPHLPERERTMVIDEVLTAADAISDKKEYAIIFADLAQRLPESEWVTVLSKALSAVRTIRIDRSYSDTDSEGSELRIRALSSFAQYLPAELVSETLDVAHEIGHEIERVFALTALATHLPNELLSKTLNAVCEIKDEDYCARALGTLAPYLPNKLLDDALTAVRAFEEERRCADALSRLAPHLSGHLLDEALYTARTTGDYYARVIVMSALASRLPEYRQVTIFDEVLLTVRLFSLEANRTLYLCKLASQLPTDLMDEALNITRLIEDEEARGDVLVALAPHLPNELLGEALAIAQTIWDETGLARVLAVLAPRLPESERVKALKDALAAARKIANENERATVLGTLAPYLPESEKRKVLGEALTATRVIERTDYRAHALNLLAPHLPAQEIVNVWREKLSAACAIEEGYQRAHALDKLAPYLPDELLNEALTATQAIREAEEHVRPLSRLILRLPERERMKSFGELLTEVCAIDTWVRIRSLEILSAHLPSWGKRQPQYAYDTFAQILPMLAARPRPEFLEDLTALMPFILALAGDEAPQAAEGIYHAIQEVCGWWP